MKDIEYKNLYECKVGDTVRFKLNTISGSHYYGYVHSINHIGNTETSIVEADIICVSNEQLCIGFDESDDIYPAIGWPSKDQGIPEIINSGKEYGCWMTSDIIVGVVSKLQVVDINQKCIECKLPAPHGEPNADGKFVCLSCNILNQLVG
jgi:hypothetical protein